MVKFISEMHSSIVISLMSQCHTDSNILFNVQKCHSYANIVHLFCKYSPSVTGRDHGEGLETQHH